MIVSRIFVLCSLVLLPVACEVPRRGTAQPSSVNDVAKGDAKGDQVAKEDAKGDQVAKGDAKGDQVAKGDAKGDQVAKEQAAKPAKSMPASEQRRVDGRRPIPASKSSPYLIASVVAYRYGAPPEPIFPADAFVELKPQSSRQDRFARVDSFVVGPVVLQPPRRDWEAALMSKGLRLLEREKLDSFEFEHFLQSASVRQDEDLRTLKDAGQGSGEQLTFGAKLVGRQSFPRSGAAWWSWFGEAVLPLLNGKNLAKADQLPTGMVQPAHCLLELGDFEDVVDKVQLPCEPPTAARIAHLPRLADILQLEAWTSDGLVDGGDWTTTEDDPFRHSCTGGMVYFDPVEKSLWTFADAWAGGAVERDAYIARRTTFETSKCAECLQESSIRRKVAPDPQSTPTRWKCRKCQAEGKVEYFDGYQPPGAVDWTDTLVVSCKWLPAKAGAYPVLRAGVEASMAGTFKFYGRGWTGESIAKLVAPQALMGRAPLRWCVVKADGSVVIMTPAELDKLREALGIEGPSELPVPVVDADGVQAWSPSSATHAPGSIGIAVARTSVSARLVDVASTRVIASGKLELSYLDLLDAPVSIRIDADGPDLSAWPSTTDQSAKLRARLMDVLATMLKP
jgi:hypothetical protein